MNVLESFSLQNKVALVTGGAGLYGRQIVAALAEAGAQTYLAARTMENSESVAAEQRALGHDVTALPLDQAEEESVLALRDTILEQSGRLDVLVNNAVLRPMTDGFRSEAATFARSMEVNATGLFIITRALGDVMQEQGSGSIINIGSIQGMVGPDETLYEGTAMNGWSPDYFFHKGGMINFTRFVAAYYGACGVRCNCISAGGFFNDQPEPFLRRYRARTFLRRMADDTDLKGIIAYLAADASRYMTGANLALDGGYTAK